MPPVLVTLLVEGGPNGDGVVLNGRGTPHAVFTIREVVRWLVSCGIDHG